MRKLFRSLFGSAKLPAAVMHGGAVKLKVPPAGPQLPKISMKPLLQMAGVETIYVNWPSPADTLAIEAILLEHAGDRDAPQTTVAVLAALLQILCELPRATSLRIALAYPDAVEALFQHTFREMRGGMPLDDPRLSERLPAVLAGER